MTDSTELIPTSTTPLVPRHLLIEKLAEYLRINVSAGDASESTILAYLSHIEQYAQWCRHTGIDASAATEMDMAMYRRHIVRRGYTRGTISVKLSALRRFYQAVVWHGLRADNPAEGLKAPRDHTTREDRILERYLSRGEVDSLLALPDLTTLAGRRDKAMMGLLYYHGLRVSEAAHLAVEDVKLSGRPQMTVRRSKGGKDRTLLLVDITINMLLDWLGARRQIVTRGDGEALFLSLSKATRGAGITAPGIRWVVNRYMVRAGVRRPGVSCHALRHAHASHALDAGADLAALSREMGHANISTTNVYLHVVDSVRQNPAAYLAKQTTTPQEVTT